MEISLPWFNKVLNPNDTSHWAVKMNAKKTQKSTAFWLGLEAKAPKKADIYNLEIIFYPPCNRARDIDNCLAACKSMLDGLAMAWKVNDKQFRYKELIFGDVIKKGMILIRINEDD